MSCCCGDNAPVDLALLTTPSPTGITSPTWFRRVGLVLHWGLTLSVLALIPKCPACVAGYVLLFTGIGLSFAVATAVRWTLILLSLASLAYLSLRALRLRGRRKKRTAASVTA